MQSLWRRGFAGLVLLFGLVVFAPLASGQVTLPIEGTGSVAGNSGAFTYSIPIEVPPGRHGLTPQLSLVYNSSAGNGFLGVGWDLPIGYVMRSTKYGVDYACNPATSPNPCFVFMMGGASSELIPRTDWCPDCYGAKIEGAFMKFRFVNGAYWEVTDKSGTKYLLGQTASSRQDGTPGVFKWMLDAVMDTRSNTIGYSYFKHQGEIYIDQINYQQNSITFYREGRSDVPTMYTSNFAVTTAYRLAAIDVWANGTHVRAYKLTFNPSSNTSRSLLASVQQFDKDATVNSNGTIIGGTALPAVNFGFSAQGDGHFSAVETDTSGWGDWSAGKFFSTGDFNGDGKTDWSWYAPWRNRFVVMRSTPLGSSTVLNDT